MDALILEEPYLSYLLKALAHFVKLPAKKMWLDHSEGIILDYREDTLVGLTILEASQR
jgi:hypothetical protein